MLWFNNKPTPERTQAATPEFSSSMTVPMPVESVQLLIREALGNSNNLSSLGAVAQRIISTGYLEQSFVYDVIYEMLRNTLTSVKGSPHREATEKSLWTWTRELKIPDNDVFKMSEEVQRQLMQQSSSSIVKAQSSAVVSTSPNRPVEEEEDNIQFVYLDRDGCDDNVLTVLGQSLEKIYQKAGFSSIRYVAHSRNSLRVIRYTMKAKLKDYMDFNALSSDKMTNALNYIGIKDPSICPGLYGDFEIHVPKPKKFWKHCGYKTLLEMDEKQRVRRADPTTAPIYNVGLGLEGNLSRISWEQPFLFAGMTRSGKSTFAQQIILSTILRYRPEWVSLGLIDLRMKTMTPFAGLPQVWNGEIITDVERAIYFLRLTLQEIFDRDKKLTKLGLTKIWSYNARMLSKNEPIMPIWGVLIDEIDTLKSRQSRAVCTEIDKLLEDIARQGSGNGVLLGVGAHTPTEESLTTDVRNMCPTRVVLHSTKSASRHIFDDKTKKGEIAFKLQGEGDSWLYYMGQEPQRTQLGYLDEKSLGDTLEYVRNLYRGYKPTIVDNVIPEVINTPVSTPTQVEDSYEEENELIRSLASSVGPSSFKPTFQNVTKTLKTDVSTAAKKQA